MLDQVELEAALERIFRCPVTQEQLDEFGAFDTLEEAIEAAATSDDAELVRTVISFYQVFLGRIPDEEGLDFWVFVLKEGLLTIQDLSSTFAGSPEFDSLYGNFTVEGIVREMYKNNLDRDPLNSDELDVEGFEFWVDVTNARIAAFIDAGLSPEDARDEAFEQLAIDFTLASETQDVVFTDFLDAMLINMGNDEQVFADPADLGSADTLFDVIEGSGQVELEGGQIISNDNRFFLHVESVPGATTIENAPFGLTGSISDVDALRLTGDAALRIDFTDPREQLEQIDLDGDGVIIPGETDFNVRDLVDLQFMEIIDAHPRGPALLDPTDIENGFTGDLFIDGTGFAGDGVSTNGNIILGGYGQDIIFTGNGNDFISSGGLDDIIKAGRNADFIFQELGTIDDLLVFEDRPGDGGVFAGDDYEVDGGATFDDDPKQDSDWLLLEAGDDEEPVEVDLDFFGDESGLVETRLGNDGVRVENIENVNASGNFYKFLDIRLIQSSSTALVGYGDFLDADEAAGLSEGFTFRTVGGDFTVTRAAIEAFNGGAGVASVQDLRDLTQATLDAEAGAGVFTVAAADDPNSTDDTGPVVFVTANESAFFFDDDPILNSVEDELARGQAFEETELVGGLFDDLFFGDNRDFSSEEAIFRVPGLSPGVTAQMIIDGTDEMNTIIAGYDNDYVEGDGAMDVLFGGDLEFLLTHQHNPNLFDLLTDTISVNGSDGIADVGRDTLIGGEGDDGIHWDAAGGTFHADFGVIGSEGEFEEFNHGHEDVLFVTTFSVGRLTSVSRSTDGSEVQFLAVNGIGEQATQDLTGVAEEDDEDDALDALTEDSVLRFDLSVGFGNDYQGNGIDPTFINPVGDQAFAGLNGADRAGTADQTNYADGHAASIITEFEHFNASGLSMKLDYMAAGTNDPELLFENQQNYRGTNSDIDVRGVDNPFGEDSAFQGDAGEDNGEDLARDSNFTNSDFTLSQLIADFNVFSVDAEGNPLDALVYSASNDGGLGFARDTGDSGYRLPSALNDHLTHADNKLFTSRGDDVLEGRGGDDWLEGRENTELANGDVLGDTFIVSTNDGDNVAGGRTLDRLLDIADTIRVGFQTSNIGSAEDVEAGDRIFFTNGASARVAKIETFDLECFDGSIEDYDDDVSGNGFLILDEIEGDFAELLEVGSFSGTEVFTDSQNSFSANFDLDFFSSRDNTRPSRDEEREPGVEILKLDNTIFGDDINIIARRLDADQDGLVDKVDGRVTLGQDFRPFIGESVAPDTRLSVFQVQPIGGEADTFDIPGGVDNWENFIGLTFRDTNGNDILSVTLDQSFGNASSVAPALETALNNAAGANIFDVSPAASVEDPDTSETDEDGGFLDAVLIKFDASAAAAAGFPIDPDREPVATFTSVENAGFGVLQLPDEVTPGEVNRQTEDDEIVFRAYQNRLDDESVPDQQASLGREAYAEDLVVGVQNGTTKLVEGQEYKIFIDDLKDNDTVTLKINGTPYVLTVGFDPVTGEDITGESTDDFLQRFAEFINDEIARDPNGRDGNVGVMFIDPTGGMDNPNDSDGENGSGLMIREMEKAMDFGEHVFLQFPMVTIANNSGGDAPSVIIKETSDTSVVLFNYDFRDGETDGLNRDVDVHAQRDGGTDNDVHDRFITFEDSTGINRAILQNANGESDAAPLLGLDVVAFSVDTSPDHFEGPIFDGGDGFSLATEVLIQDAIDNDQLTAHLQRDSEDGGVAAVLGNGGGVIGQPTNGGYSALHGDDNLLGSDLIDHIYGRTGDDRIDASRNFDLRHDELYDGGVNIVVDTATGQIIEDEGTRRGLAQVAAAGQVLLTFKDVLTIREGIDSNGNDVFDEDALFIFNVTGIAEDFSVDGLLDVDEDQDGLIEHTAEARNFEVVRTLSDTEMDTLDFSGADILDVTYDNRDGMGFTTLFSGEGEEDPTGQAQLMGFETIIGTAGEDVLLGGAQNELIIGGAGEDFIDGNGGDDTLEGGLGNDLVFGGDGDDMIDGGLGEDGLLGEDGNDTIDGDEGEDFIDGGDGDDVISGGLGNDAAEGEDGDDVIDGDEGDDKLIGGDGDDLVNGGIGNDVLDGDDFDDDSTNGHDTVLGGSGDDVFKATEDGHHDLMDGEEGNEYFLLDERDGGNDPSDVDEDTLTGGDEVGDRTIGQKTDLDGFTGALTLTFFGDDADDNNEALTIRFLVDHKIFDLEVPEVFFGDAADIIMPSEIAIAVQDAWNTEAGTAGSPIEGSTASASGADLDISGLDSIFLLDFIASGTLAADINDRLDLVSDQGENVDLDLSFTDATDLDHFFFNGGDIIISPDTFSDDVIFHGQGDGDTIMGGGGDDITIVGSKDDPTTIFNPFGLPNFAQSALGLGNTDTGDPDPNQGDSEFLLQGGAGDDSMTGSDVTDLGETFKGAGGNDTMNGGGGEDTMFGEDGDDVINGEEGEDTIEGGSGDDMIDGGEGEDEIEGNEGDDSILGGEDNDLITGGSSFSPSSTATETGDDTIDGEEGDDTIFGEDGNDSLSGGDGEDVVHGGEGNDMIFGNDGDDVLFGQEGQDTILGGDGDDTIRGDGDPGDVGVDGPPENALTNDVLTGGEGEDVFVFAGNDNGANPSFPAENAGPPVNENLGTPFLTEVDSQITSGGPDFITDLTLSANGPFIDRLDFRLLEDAGFDSYNPGNQPGNGELDVVRLDGAEDIDDIVVNSIIAGIPVGQIGTPFEPGNRADIYVFYEHNGTNTFDFRMIFETGDRDGILDIFDFVLDGTVTIDDLVLGGGEGAENGQIEDAFEAAIITNFLIA